MSRFSQGHIYPSGTVAPPATAFIGSQTNNAAASTTVTWTNGGGGFDLGAGSADLWAIVAIFYGSVGIRVPDSVTIGGVTCTQVIRSAVSGRGVDLYYANVPSGGGSNVFASFSGNANTGACAVWSFRGALDTANIGSSSAAGGANFNSSASIHKTGALAVVVGNTTSNNAVTFNEPSAADFQTNETVSTTFRFAGGNHANLNAGTYTPDISVGVGTLANAACAVFPPT